MKRAHGCELRGTANSAKRWWSIDGGREGVGGVVGGGTRGKREVGVIISLLYRCQVDGTFWGFKREF